MKYYIIAGEASGDLHGANLIKQLLVLDPDANFRAWGGDLMKAQGVELVKHIKDLAFMGFVEVIQNIRTITRNLKLCKEDIEEFNPDAVIFIDYPGFNLKIAEHVKQLGIKTIYYVSPQIWAWKESRVHKIKKLVDEMMVILPFEKAFYEKYDYPVHYVGHPLIDAIDQHIKDNDFFNRNKLDINKPIIALLPGSRDQEIKEKLKYMLSVINDFKNYQFVIAGAPNKDNLFYQQFLTGSEQVKLVTNDTYNLLQYSTAALVTSGTATLETALFNVPEVVCYKGNKLSYLLAKNLIKVKYISLVNLILDKLAVKELIQDDLNYQNLKQELNLVLHDNRENIFSDYAKLRDALGGGGASRKAAQIVYNSVTG